MSIPLPEALKTNRFIAAELRPNTIESDSEIDLTSGISSLSESILNQVLGENSILTRTYDYDRSINSNYLNDPYLPYLNSNKKNHTLKMKTLDYNNFNNNHQYRTVSSGIDAKKYTESPL